MEWIAGAAAAAGGGASERQTLHPLGMAEREFLRHHAAEGNAERSGAGPPDGVHHRRRIVAIVGHAIGAVRLARLTEAALVIGEERKAPRQRAFKDAGLAPEIAIG